MLRKREELLGKTIGKLYVVREIEKTKDSVIRYECRCSCGNTKIISRGPLLNKKTLSCGCYRKELMSTGRLNQKELGISDFNSIYASYRCGAEKRNLVFELDKEQFRKITQGNCFYCGAVPTHKHIANNSHGYYEFNGIDRLDIKIGYVIENCVSCCITCNKGKGTKTRDEFLKWILDVYTHNFGAE